MTMKKKQRKAQRAKAKAEERGACWICLDDEVDDSGKPTVRDCSCRGSTGLGYAHISCLVQFATKKKADIRRGRAKVDEDGNDPFVHCPKCKQEYNGELCLELSRAHVKTTIQLPDYDPDKIYAHSALAQALEGVGNYDEADKEFVCNLQRLRHERLTRIDLFQEAELGILILLSKCRIKNGAISEAFRALEEARDLALKRNDKAALVNINREMREVKSKFGMDVSDYDTKSPVEVARLNLEKEIDEYCKDSSDAVIATMPLIFAYAENGDFVQALKLSKESHELASRVFGKEHKHTLWFDKQHKFIRRKYGRALKNSKDRMV